MSIDIVFTSFKSQYKFRYRRFRLHFSSKDSPIPFSSFPFALLSDFSYTIDAPSSETTVLERDCKNIGCCAKLGQREIL